MSQITLHIKLDPYLAQWFIHENGGKVPVTLGKGSIESKILESYLMKQPQEILPDMGGEDTVAIYIPDFRNRDAEYYNYLPSHARKALIECIRNRFDVLLWNTLHHFGRICNKRQDWLIYAFMEKHGIELTETNWNVIAKRYQRQRKQYLDREMKKFKRISSKKTLK